MNTICQYPFSIEYDLARKENDLKRLKAHIEALARRKYRHAWRTRLAKDADISLPTLNTALSRRSKRLSVEVFWALESALGPLRPPSEQRRLTPSEMRSLFDQWVHDVGESAVIKVELWAAMEAGFNDGIARVAEEGGALDEPEEPPEESIQSDQEERA